MAKCKHVKERESNLKDDTCNLGIVPNKDEICLSRCCLFCNKKDVDINIGDRIIATDNIRKQDLIGKNGTVREINKSSAPYKVYFENYWSEGVGLEYSCYEDSIEKI